jgi:simple sugar transport system ATP-binding protein
MEVVEPRAFIPEDRTTEGLIPHLSLTENLVLGRGEEAPWIRGPWIRWPQARSRALELVGEFNIHAPGPDAPVASLSGGNQQKLVIARALDTGPRVVVAENPTRGLDVQASSEVHSRLREAARSGCAVLFYSSDLDEVLDLADRIVVMTDGRSIEAAVGAGRAEVGALMLLAEKRDDR